MGLDSVVSRHTVSIGNLNTSFIALCPRIGM